MGPYLPTTLVPRGEVEFLLPSGRSIGIRRARVAWKEWRGTSGTETGPAGEPVAATGEPTILPRTDVSGDEERVDPRAVIDLEGRRATPELAVLWTLNQAGWSGVCIDRPETALRTSVTPDVPMAPLESLSPAAADLLERIQKSAGPRTTRRGTWRVFCWREDEFLFAEPLREGREQVRGAQVAWLEAALLSGCLPDWFLLVDWHLER